MTEWETIQSRFLAMNPKELNEQAEQARREKGKLLYEIGERHYTRLRTEGKHEEIRAILEQEVLIYGALLRIEEMEREAARRACKTCKATLEPGAKFCGTCGTPVPQEAGAKKTPCRACRTLQPADQPYCTCCGSEMSGLS
ncbi:zinc ribbon domain-containing protein [Exiguobacterium flavidum]|uniref:zinc ribbon domain-containing protein n=1 Tax=Exiguobacterium flavidum TaxID=2184695 RepID=UPI000DF77188|nr:zinc ribbon domain-containing protein [Exiguobacterium flavidum]